MARSKETRRLLSRINPTFWLFIIGFFLFLIGASFQALYLLKVIGGVIVLIYLVVAVIWVISHIHH